MQYKDRRDFTKELHKRRMTHHVNDVDIRKNPELLKSWESLQLHWLQTVPGYREELKKRVSEAAKRAETRSKQIEVSYKNIDYLGREVEGCG